MLTKEQADRIADDLLAQARTRKFGFTDPAGVPVSPVYQCRDLRSLPDGLQLEVVLQATKEVATGPLFLVLMLVWLLVLCALWLFVPRLIATPAAIVPLISCSWLVPLAVRTVLIRRTVRLVAARLAGC
jgi:hypothetical protein